MGFQKPESDFRKEKITYWINYATEYWQSLQEDDAPYFLRDKHHRKILYLKEINSLNQPLCIVIGCTILNQYVKKIIPQNCIFYERKQSVAFKLPITKINIFSPKSAIDRFPKMWYDNFYRCNILIWVYNKKKLKPN